MTDNRVPAGVPTGGQFAASAKSESAVALASTNLHPEVLAAIAQAKATGKPVRLEDLSSCGFDEGENSSACGDYSLGKEPSNRMTWATGKDDEPFVSVTSTYYVTARRDGDTNDLDYDAWQEAVAEHEAWEKADESTRGDEPERLRYSWDNQTEWIAHTDLDDVGGTEVRSDYEYDHGSALYFETLERAETAATNMAIREEWDHYAPENWKVGS